MNVTLPAVGVGGVTHVLRLGPTLSAQRGLRVLEHGLMAGRYLLIPYGG